LDTVPQFLPQHASACDFGVQPHTLGVPAPPHDCGLVQEPQLYVPPQASETVPQFLPEQALACVTGMQPQTLGVPPPPQD
jgi:hypothetical protein